MQNRALRFLFGVALFGLMITSVPTAFCKDKQLYPKDAEPATVRANAKVWRELPFMNTEDFQDAARGWIATIPDALIYGDDGQVAWSLKEYDFLFAGRGPAHRQSQSLASSAPQHGERPL